MKSGPKSDTLLSLQLTVDYAGRPGVLRDIEFEMRRGEILGLVGKSGSGKSTLSLAVLRLLDWKRGKMHGRIEFLDRDLLTLSESEMRRLRGRNMALVQQSPLTALNPYLTIG